ncbi:MAG: homocysteine S-methyltransferase family protein, partial [Gemmatimonadaceae bacterium]
VPILPSAPTPSSVAAAPFLATTTPVGPVSSSAAPLAGVAVPAGAGAGRLKFLPLDEIAACAQLHDAEPQVVAMGANCVDPALVESIVREFGAVTGKPIIVYPNSGERWNATARCWEGTAARFPAFVPSWVAAGASWIGGCCRTTPGDIRAVRATLDDLRAQTR